MTVRSYGQHCSLAALARPARRALDDADLRELMLGPARFRDLLDALPGIGTNLLSARLKALEAAEVVTRGRRRAMRSTRAARRCGRSLEDIARWGFALMPDQPGEDVVQPAWAALLDARGAWPTRRGRGRGRLRLRRRRRPVLAASRRPTASTCAAAPPPVAPDATLRADVADFFVRRDRAQAPLASGLAEGDAERAPSAC